MIYRLPITPVTISTKSKSVTYRLPPSLNKRLHWSLKRRWNGLFAEQVFWAVKQNKIAPASKIRVELINKTCYPMDRDNLYSSAKPLIDALVRAGVVPDDKDKYVDLYCRNEQANGLKDQSVYLEIEIISSL